MLIGQQGEAVFGYLVQVVVESYSVIRMLASRCHSCGTKGGPRSRPELSTPFKTVANKFH